MFRRAKTGALPSAPWVLIGKSCIVYRRLPSVLIRSASSTPASCTTVPVLDTGVPTGAGPALITKTDPLPNGPRACRRFFT